MKMPALGESVTEGTVTRWLKQVGDTVEVDEPLLEVSTDKVDTEIPSPVAGTSWRSRSPRTRPSTVGAELAVIGAAGARPAAAPTPGRARAGSRPPRRRPSPAAAGARRRSRPAAARAGSGAAPAPAAAPAAPAPAPAAPHRPPAGRSTATATPATSPRWSASSPPSTASTWPRSPAPASAAASASRTSSTPPRRPRPPPRPPPPAAAAPAAAAPAAEGRAEPAARPHREDVPAARGHRQAHGRVAAGLGAAHHGGRGRRHQIAKLRDQAKADFQARHGVKLSFLPFFALAAVEALQAHPIVNASIDLEAGTVTYHDAEHLGIAVDTEHGLIVPVIHDAGDLNLAGLAKRIADLAERTRTNKISPDELSGGTFTLTNTGSRGALFDTPIINQPQVGILGTGAVVKRAVVVDDPDLGEIIAPRSMVYLALSYDHRLVDGADAARFLVTIKERLEAGEFEADLGLSLA